MSPEPPENAPPPEHEPEVLGPKAELGGLPGDAPVPAGPGEAPPELPVATAPRSNFARAFPVTLVGLGVVVAGMVLMNRVQGGTGILPSPVKMDPRIELQFQGVTMQGMDKGTPRWTITARKVTASQNQQVVDFVGDPKGRFMNLKDFNATASDAVQHHSVDWTAGGAQYDSFSDTMTISGKAVFKTDRQDVLKSDKVVFRPKSHHVEVPERLVLEAHDNTTIQADRATADTTLETLDLQGHVQITEPVNAKNGPLAGIGGAP